ncbi:uncharacterized protein LOC141640829 [Silene latifolia]|uniref:uncharacterized protein LOC141640829 n=1 Tax=Silene latifolia TaxID=37657 RepID=UPI003D789E40
MNDFQACINYCSFIDCPAIGSFYTWNNKQDPSTRVYSRLDRVLVNQEWLHARMDTCAHFLNDGLFDHTPCIIQLRNNSMVGRKSFKYFTMWSSVDDFIPCIQQIWDQHWSGQKMFKVVMKLKSLKKPLKDLNSKMFADIENSTVHAWKTLDSIQSQLSQSPTDEGLILQEIEALKIYRDLQKACDSFLLQK